MSGSYVPPFVPTDAVVSATVSLASSQVSDAAHEFGLESQAAAQRRLEEEEAANRRWTRIVAGIAAGSMSTALVAMYIEASIVAIVAFMFPLLTAPYTVIQRRQLNKLPSMTHEINGVRHEVNRLHIEKIKLSTEIDQLEEQVAKLSRVEILLKQHTDAQGRDVNEFRSLVKENGDIIRRQKKIQETRVMQSLLTAIMKSDGDGDFHINDEEMETLILRMRNIEGVQIDERKLRNQFRASISNSMASLLEVTKSVLQEEDLELTRNV